MATPISPAPPFITAGMGSSFPASSELERSLARSTMTLGAGLLSAGLIWQLSNSGGPRSLMLLGGVLSAFGWAWLMRTTVEEDQLPPSQGVTIEGEFI